LTEAASINSFATLGGRRRVRPDRWVGSQRLGSRPGTKDVDIVVDPDIENLRRVAGVAEAVNGYVQTGESFLSSQPSIAGQLASGEQIAIETELGRLDIVQGLDGVPSFEELHARATQAEVLGVRVAVCSVEDLKAMKQAAGRTRDLADLEDLDAAGS
jgi:hypothetical protein